MRALLLAGLLCLPQMTAAQDAAAGQLIYERSCITCHGVAGQGDGPMVGNLLVQPADLTQLSKSNDGVFPIVRVLSRIDGRDPLVSHGSDMPIYGWYFEGESYVMRTPAGQPILTTVPVADLVAYLETFQVE
ncbi:Cytochrome c [Cognatiyoonia koreensis]|uniref:Cytochrome c n=1 Tax=Cognatiyoonia koreensis TaxID=364200 RepID=A0A1I0Q999_9RHOB|nr:cytochrome c [Cognatiyoonia koreensis]SEW23593.1 Cytochrome c [Cognatiyoonia koreensis]